MDRKVIRIWYAPDESGPAELISDNLARIIDVPLLAGGLWRDDIVRLTHQPGEADGWPKIEEVVFRRFAGQALVNIHQMHEAYVLTGVFASLKADSALLFEPKDDKPGMLAVAFNPPLDPIGLAETIGIDQDLGDDGDQDDEPAAPQATPGGASGDNPVPPPTDALPGGSLAGKAQLGGLKIVK